MKRYDMKIGRRLRWPRRVLWVMGGVIVVLLAAIIVIRQVYNANLKPLSPHPAQAKSITVESGMTAREIADMLHDRGIIRSAWSFSWYVQNKEVRDALQAGTYSLSPSQSVPDIVAQLTHGKVSTELVTILPGQRLDQIERALVNDGFKAADVKAALQPEQYDTSAALVDKPQGASLEGYLYPDSFQKTSATKPRVIIEESLGLMQRHLTPDIRAAFAKRGLSVYQGIILASIVEREAADTSERAKVAKVFYNRLAANMPLQSDPTAMYGAELAGKRGLSPDEAIAFDSPYNTYKRSGLPPTPISNVSDSSLRAVAYPADTNALYFVAGNDCVTRFSATLQEHEQNIAKYGVSCKH